jgi:hypothetical protein
MYANLFLGVFRPNKGLFLGSMVENNHLFFHMVENPRIKQITSAI